MKTTKRTTCLLAASALVLAAMMPVAASAHTHVFLGINLGGLFAPPVEVYSPPVYYAPRPVYYAPRPAYYVPPRVIYTEPYPIYYRYRDRDRDGYWRRDRDYRADREWHRRWEHHDDDDDR